MKDFDWIDIGSSKGGSVKYCISKYGRNGYGIDVDERKVKIAQSKGYDVRHQDIFTIEDKAKVVTCMHVLEHLPDREYCQRMIQKMIEIGDEVYITFPNFDDDVMLMDYGVRFFWSLWHGHTYHLNTYELYQMIRLATDRPFEIEKAILVENTMDERLIPIDAPVDSFEYKSEMGAKEAYKLDNVYKEVRCRIF